jgi:hypothetical protein
VLAHLPPYLLNDRDTARGVTLGSGLVDGQQLPENERHGHGPVFCPVFPAGDVGMKDEGSALFAAARNTLITHSANSQAITPVVVLAARLGLADEAVRRLRAMVRNLQQFPNGLFFNIDHWHYLSRRSGIDVHQLGGLGQEGTEYALLQRDYLDDRGVRFRGVRVSGHALDGVEPHTADTPAWPFTQMGMESLGHFTAGIQEMLLQSHEGAIRVFPAVPADWECAFTLWAEGGFRVTSRQDPGGGPECVEIASTRGGECAVYLPWAGADARAQSDAPAPTAPCQAPASGDASRAADASVRVLRRDSLEEVAVREHDGVVAFATEAGGVYLLLRAGAAVPETRRYAASRNAAPKRFEEATIGKPPEW